MCAVDHLIASSAVRVSRVGLICAEVNAVGAIVMYSAAPLVQFENATIIASAHNFVFVRDVDKIIADRAGTIAKI